MRHEPDQLDHALSPIMPAVFGAIALLDAIWTGIDLITLTGTDRAASAGICGASALVAALVGLVLRRPTVGVSLTRPVGAFAVLSVGLNGAALLAATTQPVYAAWLTLAAVGAGALVLGFRWYLVTVVLLWLGWGSAAYVASRTSSLSVNGWVYVQLTVLMAAATVFSALLRLWRVRSLADLDRALLRAREAEVRDPLTGVANVAGLNLLGSQVMDAARRHGDAVHCLVMDVDGLGLVNDQLGHLVGDAVLVGVADALVSAMRSGDVVARWGGDEFVVVGAGSGPSALEVERRVRAGLVESPPASPQVWSGRVSAGRAVKEPWDDDTLESLLERADREMLLRRALRREAGATPYRPSSVDKSEMPPAQRHRPGAAPQSW